MNKYEYRVEIADDAVAIVKMDLIQKYGSVITIPLTELDDFIDKLNNIKMEVCGKC